MNAQQQQRASATVAMLAMLIGVIAGLTLANAAGLGWRDATAIAGACGAVGLVVGARVVGR